MDVILSNSEPPHPIRRRHFRGFADYLVRATSAPLTPAAGAIDATLSPSSWALGPGERLALAVTLLPDAVFANRGFAAAAGGIAQSRPAWPGLFGSGDLGMHAAAID